MVALWKDEFHTNASGDGVCGIAEAFSTSGLIDVAVAEEPQLVQSQCHNRRDESATLQS